MRCCLMAYLPKVLSDMLQSPQPLSHIHICPKPKVKLGPTETFYSAPPNSLDIAIATNPNQFSHTDGLVNSLLPIAISRSHRDMQSVPPSVLGQLSVSLITQIGTIEFV